MIYPTTLCSRATSLRFAALRDGQPDQATKLLGEAERRCDTAAWPYPIIKYLRGEIDEATLTAAASDSDRMTELNCFLGLGCLQKEKREAALDHFRWVMEHGNPDLTQYAISPAELDHLKGK
jgi:hypothetical protein